ncbi:T9SS type A sorting domain-containing protein, partial [bacterium]|nr:T9SS type A sorting domain-containing protein [bacterium]
SYTGRMTSKAEMVVLSGYLPAAQSVFTLRFLFLSDFSNSDEDGGFDSYGCQVFSIDDIAVRGGGLDYFSDFESDAGGWRQDTLSSEFFLVAYRKRNGFDKNLPGEGLLIWHAEDAIAYSTLKNSGGSSNTQTRGVVLEEADGDYDLLFDCDRDRNYGDAGDPFPGITGNTSFSSETTPNSRSNGGAVTPIYIRDIHSGYGYIEPVFRAGNPEPSISYVIPDTLSKSEFDNRVFLDIYGENILPPVECYLASRTENVKASSVSWLGEGRIIAEFNPEQFYGGYWSLNLKNGDGQLASRTEAVFVNSIYCYAYAQVISCFVDIDWKIEGDMPFGSLVYRVPYGQTDFVMITPDTLFSSDGVFHLRDTEVEPRQDYSYKIISFSGSVSESIFFPGPFRIEKMPLTLFQNYPNPFATVTTLRFYLPRSAKAKILFFDVSGREIERITEKFYPAGYNTVNFEADSSLFVSGVYFCVIDAEGKRKAIKMVILR